MTYRKPVIGLNMSYAWWNKKWRFNLRAPYVESVLNSGGVPLLIPALSDGTVLDDYLDLVDGVILTGGEDYPPRFYHEAPRAKLSLCSNRRAKWDLLLTRRVLERDIPLLGICAGHQMINIALGGKLVQHLPSSRRHKGEKYHFIDIVGGRWLQEMFKGRRMLVNSSHHQAILPSHVGKDLLVTAFSDDGVIEAVESTRHRFVMGLQWHPERIKFAAHNRFVFGFFIDQCRQGRTMISEAP